MALNFTLSGAATLVNTASSSLTDTPGVSRSLCVFGVATWPGVTQAQLDATTCTDDVGNTYTLVLSQAGNGQAIVAFFCPRNVASGSLTVTMTLNGIYTVGVWSLQMAMFNDNAYPPAGTLRTPLVLDRAASATGVGTAPASGATAALRTTGPECIQLGILSAGPGNVSPTTMAFNTATPAWVEWFNRTLQPSLSIGARQLTTGSPGTTPNAVWTASASISWTAAILVFSRSDELPGPFAKFTTVGASTWNWPAGVTTVTAECLGGAGGSGTASGNPATGGGGKGGSYARATITKGADASLTINVGAGGAATPAAGNPSSVVQAGTTRVLASGGGPGATQATNSANGAGGTTVNGTAVGTVQFVGGNGGTGAFASGPASSGAGGGAAGPAGNGGAGSVAVEGVAGAGRWANDCAYQGSGTYGVGDSSPGFLHAQSTYGGAPSGGKANANQDKAGAAGAQGLVLLTWTPPVSAQQPMSLIL